MRLSLLFWLFILSPAAMALPPPPFSHQLLDVVLRSYVDSTGMVDYSGLKANRTALDAYIDSLAGTSPSNRPERFANRSAELAYWINAYNAFVLRGVIDAYPVESVKEIGFLSGFFNRKKVDAGGQSLTLNDIENEIIRPLYREPRIHFAVNCGAVSCPSLSRRAYAGDDLEGQLEQALVRFARDPKHVELGVDGRLQLSKILDWYGADFVKWFPADRPEKPADPTIVDYLFPYLPAPIAAHLKKQPDTKIEYKEYDWALNRQRASH